MGNPVNKPTVGRIVHFQEQGTGKVRPAIVTEVHSESCINVEVFGLESKLIVTSLCTLDKPWDKTSPPSWFWPPRS